MPLWGMLVSSTYAIVALTLERYLAVVYPIWYKIAFNRSKACLPYGLNFINNNSIRSCISDRWIPDFFSNLDMFVPAKRR